MFKNSKILILAFVILLIIGIFIFWFLNNQKPVENQGKKSGLSEITGDYQNMDYPEFFDQNKKILFFDNEYNQFSELNLNNGKVQRLSKTMGMIKNILWLIPEKKVIILAKNTSFAKQPNPLFSFERNLDSNNYWFYDIDTQQAELLDKNIDNVFWSKEAEKIIYYFYSDANYGDSEDNATLTLSNSDGTNWQNLSNIGLIGKILWFYPESKKILIENEANYYLIQYETKQSKQILKNITNFQLSPDGKSAIIQLKKSNKTYYIPDIENNDNKKLLKIANPINKIVWSSDKKFVILTQSDKKNNDKFYKINLESLAISELKYQNKNKIKAKHLFFDQTDKNLYFTSQGKLYKMKIR